MLQILRKRFQFDIITLFFVIIFSHLSRYSQARSSVSPQAAINEFIIRKLNPLVVVDFRFVSAFLHA